MLLAQNPYRCESSGLEAWKTYFFDAFAKNIVFYDENWFLLIFVKLYAKNAFFLELLLYFAQKCVSCAFWKMTLPQTMELTF